MTSVDDVFRCPGCGSRAVGQIGTRQYFCWECCVEFSRQNNGQLELFNVLADGTLEAVQGAVDSLEGKGGA
jgi:DNA-directed RNA polymerase subunit RPC12/RpoP